jgi:RimJ/RimL family protein N-acetyltransferase
MKTSWRIAFEPQTVFISTTPYNLSTLNPNNTMADLFHSERLLYRAFEAPADDEFFHKCQIDPEVFNNAINFVPRPWSATMSVERRKVVDGALLFVVICKKPESSPSDNGSGNDQEGQKPTPTPVGFIRLRGGSHPNSTHHRSVIMGVCLVKQHHGNGYGEEAVKWALNWAFKMAGLHRVGLDVYEWNMRAQKMYQKVGFITEGRARENSWNQGRWWDTIHMSILDHEWEKLKKHPN